MKRILRTLILVLLVGGLVYKYGDTIRPLIAPYGERVRVGLGAFSKPCKEPIPYILGDFDARFGISKEDFLVELVKAEAIWEKPVGRELFVHKPESTKVTTLKVNLIYDYRAEATQKLESLGTVVDESRASYDILRSKFIQLKSQFEILKSSYDISVNNFNSRQRAYEKQVDYWNSKGGAPKGEYEKLERERASLQRESAQLAIKQEEINSMVEEINAMVVVLNRLARNLNISVDEYNTIGASRGESFEEGVFQSDGINRQIDIYEFSSREKLLRVLAHELGHALGLDHVEDPNAIMYRLNHGDSKALTEADLVAVRTKCEI